VIFSLEEGKSPYGMSISRRDGKSAPVVLLQISEDEAAHRKIIEFMTVSRTGRFIAVGTSEAGTEVTQVQVIDARTGKSLADRSYRVELGGLEWFPDDSGYIYLQGPDHEKTALQDRNKEFAVMWHEIGKPFEQDVEVAGAHAPGARIYGDYDFPFPYISPNGRDVVVSVEHGVDHDLAIFSKSRRELLDKKSEWKHLYEHSDRVNSVAAADGRLLATRNLGDDQYVLEQTSLDATHTRRVLYSSKYPLEHILISGKDAYVVETRLATKYVVLVRSGGGAAPPISLPEGTSVYPRSLRVDPLTNKLVIDLRAWTEPRSWWLLAPGKNAAEPLFDVPSTLKTAAYEVRLLEAPARDGERIPITLVTHKGQGNSPPKYVWVMSYGCYGTVVGPNFSIPRRLFLEFGGAYAYAHVRGGGEKGRRWHEQAMGARKVKTIEDFIDSVKFLRGEGFGKDGGLVVTGGSAGGIPAGGLLAREPGLVDGAFIDIGVVNASRMEGGSAVGALHRQEFGASDTPEGARHLRDIDAYLNIQDGRPYPMTLLRSGVSDPRVPRWQSSKFVARLQQATKGTRPILLRLTGGGHGVGGSPEEDALVDAEVTAFMLTAANHPDFQ